MTSHSSAARTGSRRIRLSTTLPGPPCSSTSLTEDNLPSYHREIAVRFGPDGAWGQRVGQWTAEEARHSIAIRDYLIVTRGIDPVELERGRMVHTVAGYDSGDKSMLEALAYVSFQELATRISHRNTGKASGCPLAEQLLTRVATDENLHMVFYRNLVDAAFEIAPNATMTAVAHEVINFQMPGSTMPGFAENALKIAKAGIYDLRSHLDDVVRPVLRFWRVFERDDLDGDGARARDELAAFLDLVEDKAAHYDRRREERLAGAVRPRDADALVGI